MATQVKQITADQEIRDLLEIEGSAGSNNVRSEHSRYFIVWNDDGTPMVADDAKNATGVPLLGDAMDGNVLFLANNVRTAARGGGGFAWVVEVGYTGVPFNPLAVENITENWTTQAASEPVDQGWNVNTGAVVKLTNTADENFEPAITREFSDWVMTRGKNILFFDTGFWSQFRDKINSTGYRGFPKHTALCRSISAEYRTAGINFYYWRLTYQVHFRTRFRALADNGARQEFGWNPVMANWGYREKAGVVNGNEPIYNSWVDAKGFIDSSVKALDPSGKLLKTNQPFNWLAFRIYEEHNLNGLDTA
jgi:hypothetical protein